jgi:hypothetical protein
VLGTELIGWFAEVLGKLPDGVQVKPDLEVLQHPLSKWGHNKTPFVVTTSQIDTHVEAQQRLPAFGGTTTRAFTCRRLSCVLGMLSSLEVKVLRPT